MNANKRKYKNLDPQKNANQTRPLRCAFIAKAPGTQRKSCKSP